jgi:hypothetical protein
MKGMAIIGANPASVVALFSSLTGLTTLSRLTSDLALA